MKIRTGPKKLKGAARMKQLGHTLVCVWLNPSEVSVIRKLALEEHSALSSMVRCLALSAALRNTPPMGRWEIRCELAKQSRIETD